MQVTHPLADRDAPVPAAVTCPDGETRHPDSDGVVEAPEDVAVALADAWADCYGVPPDGLLAHGDGSAADGEDMSRQALEEMTYDTLYDAATQVDISGRSQMTKGELVDALHEEE